MPCEANVRSVINVPLDYEMRLEDGLDATDATAILHEQVDVAIANHATNHFEANCDEGILGVHPGYTDYIDPTADTCDLGGNCYPCKGYVIALYNPNVLTAEGASEKVYSSIVSGMDNTVGRSGLPAGNLIADGLDPVLEIGVPQRLVVGVVGGIRSQGMSNGDGSRGGLSPGGKAGISIMCLTLFSLLVVLAYRRKKRKNEWREEDEAGIERTLEEHNASKLEVMKEIDDVVAGIDDAVLNPVATQDTDASYADEPMVSNDKPARFPIDEQGFPAAAGRGGGGEEGYEVSVC